jgi:hypothetical protein
MGGAATWKNYNAWNARFPWGDAAVRRGSLALILILLAPAVAVAHNMDFECKLHAGKLHVEAYFEDDAPAQEALVRVVDAEGKEVLRGKTDAQGKWSSAAPPGGSYRVIVDAGAGHRAEHKLSIPDAVAAASTDEPVNLGGARAEHTAFPWLRAALGVGTVAVLAVAFLLARQAARGRDEPSPAKSAGTPGGDDRPVSPKRG